MIYLVCGFIVGGAFGAAIGYCFAAMLMSGKMADACEQCIHRKDNNE